MDSHLTGRDKTTRGALLTAGYVAGGVQPASGIGLYRAMPQEAEAYHVVSKVAKKLNKEVFSMNRNYAYQLLHIILFIMCIGIHNSSASEYNSWCVYLAISPEDASVLNGEYNKKIYDITKFKYPIYVGYIYSNDLKTNNVKCFEPIAQKSMLRWAEERKNGAEIVFSLMQMPFDTEHFTFLPGDEDYIKGVASDLYYRYSLHVIRSCINCAPDENWRPIFKHQYTIDFPLTEDMAFYKLGPIMRAKDAWDVLN